MLAARHWAGVPSIALGPPQPLQRQLTSATGCTLLLLALPPATWFSSASTSHLPCRDTRYPRTAAAGPQPWVRCDAVPQPLPN
eukprot:5997899-Pyramimonas_sp.AAC.1